MVLFALQTSSSSSGKEETTQFVLVSRPLSRLPFSLLTFLLILASIISSSQPRNPNSPTLPNQPPDPPPQNPTTPSPPPSLPLLPPPPPPTSPQPQPQKSQTSPSPTPIPYGISTPRLDPKNGSTRKRKKKFTLVLGGSRGRGRFSLILDRVGGEDIGTMRIW